MHGLIRSSLSNNHFQQLYRSQSSNPVSGQRSALAGNPTNQTCAYGYPEETSRYRLPPANRSRRVCICVPQTQDTPHSRIPLNAPTKSGDQDVEVTEKKQFPVSGFSGGWNLALGSGKRRVPEKKLRFGGSRIRV